MSNFTANFKSVMKQLLIIIVAAWCSLSAMAYTERNLIASRTSREQLKELLVRDRQWVDLPAYTDRAAWDSILGSRKDAYIKRGEKALAHDWPRVKATDYLEYERSGNRKIMENPLDANNSAVADLLMAELAEGKGRFVDQLINGVYAAAEMTSWALSAHIPAVKPGRSLQAHDNHVIDLVAGDMGNLYSWVYYFMQPEFDKINPEISRRLRHEIKSWVLDPFLAYDRWWWDGSRTYNGRMLNNWSPWCLSNVLLTAMLMEEDPDRYADIAWYTILGTDKFLNYIKGDGACEEGPSYWGHAAGKTLDYIDMLNLATGGKIDMSDEKLIRDMGEYIARSYVGEGWVVNFADASARGGGDPWLIYRFGKAVDSDLLKSFASMLYDGGKIPATAATYSALSAPSASTASSPPGTNHSSAPRRLGIPRQNSAISPLLRASSSPARAASTTRATTTTMQAPSRCGPTIIPSSSTPEWAPIPARPSARSAILYGPCRAAGTICL